MPTADTARHETTTVPGVRPDTNRRECTCGWTTISYRQPTGTGHADRPCPNDPTVVALAALQFSNGGLINPQPVDGYAVHLVRSVAGGGTPGHTLCGIDRFAKGCPGWSVGGGIAGPNIVHTPCPGCADTALREYPGLPICGSVGAREMAAELGAAVTG